MVSLCLLALAVPQETDLLDRMRRRAQALGGVELSWSVWLVVRDPPANLERAIGSGKTLADGHGRLREEVFTLKLSRDLAYATAVYSIQTRTGREAVAFERLLALPTEESPSYSVRQRREDGAPLGGFAEGGFSSLCREMDPLTRAVLGAETFDALGPPTRIQEEEHGRLATWELPRTARGVPRAELLLSRDTGLPQRLTWTLDAAHGERSTTFEVTQWLQMGDSMIPREVTARYRWDSPSVETRWRYEARRIESAPPPEQLLRVPEPVSIAGGGAASARSLRLHVALDPGDDGARLALVLGEFLPYSWEMPPQERAEMLELLSRRHPGSEMVRGARNPGAWIEAPAEAPLRWFGLLRAGETDRALSEAEAGIRDPAADPVVLLAAFEVVVIASRESGRIAQLGPYWTTIRERLATEEMGPWLAALAHVGGWTAHLDPDSLRDPVARLSSALARNDAAALAAAVRSLPPDGEVRLMALDLLGSVGTTAADLGLTPETGAVVVQDLLRDGDPVSLLLAARLAHLAGDEDRARDLARTARSDLRRTAPWDRENWLPLRIWDRALHVFAGLDSADVLVDASVELAREIRRCGLGSPHTNFVPSRALPLAYEPLLRDGRYGDVVEVLAASLTGMSLADILEEGGGSDPFVRHLIADAVGEVDERGAHAVCQLLDSWRSLDRTARAEIVDGLRERFPDNPHVLLRAFRAHRRDSPPEDRLALCERIRAALAAGANSPYEAEIHSGRVEALVQLGRVDDAVEAIAQSGPRWIDAMTVANLASSRMAGGDSSAARRLYLAAVDLRPEERPFAAKVLVDRLAELEEWNAAYLVAGRTVTRGRPLYDTDSQPWSEVARRRDELAARADLDALIAREVRSARALDPEEEGRARRWVAALGAEDAAERDRAADILGLLGPAVLPIVRPLAQSQDPEVRVRAQTVVERILFDPATDE